MTTPTLTIPPLECPAVLLPTPANLANYFKGLASHAYTYEIEEIKDILEDLKPIFEPFDPKFKKIEIQEIEWEIRIQGLVDEFSSYVQAQMLDIVASLTPIEITVNILGIEVDVIKFVTDRNYSNTIFDSIDLDIDNLYAICSRCNLSMSDKYTIQEWNAFQKDKDKKNKFSCKTIW